MRQSNISGRRYMLGIGSIALSAILVVTAVVLFLRTSTHAPTLFAPQPPQPPPITCKTPHHDAGTSTVTISSAGLSRTFIVHLAPSYGRQPQALVINYHGYDMAAQDIEQASNMDAVANQASFVVVYPQGVDSPTSWNAGIGAFGPTGDADDIQFTRDLLSYVETNYCVNAHHVFLTGFSLGGGMVYRLTCNLGAQITAIATVEGAYYPLAEGCPTTRPLPVLEIHSLADPFAPYAGNPDKRMAAVQDYLNGWLSRDKCAGTSRVFFQKGDVTATQWTHCADGVMVEHYQISDLHHFWARTSTTAIDGSTVIWQFFSKYA